MIVSHTDSDYLVTGTHSGSTGTTLLDRTKDFRICGAIEGLAILNTTQGTDGNITSVSENEIVSDVSFDNGDTYEIYKTSAKDTQISYIGTDKSRGWKVTCKKELNRYGWRKEDHDIDKDQDGYRLPKDERPFGLIK